MKKMFKRVLGILLILFISLSFLSLLLLVGCDTNDNIHTHEFGEWESVKEANCTEDGRRARSCSCGEIETEVIYATGHTEEVIAANVTCTESGLSEGKMCSVCGEIMLKQEDVSALGHNYSSYTVSDERGVPLTIFTCNRDGCEFTRREYISGVYDDKNNLLASWDELVNDYGLIRLSKLNGILRENEKLASGTTIILDESVTSIYLDWFEECTNIANIVIHDSVTNISNLSLNNPIYLKNIFVDENNKDYKSIDGNLYTKDGKTLIQYAVGKEDEEFTIPDGVTRIKYLSFGFCSSIEKIVIPNSVTQIESSTFYSCVSLKNLFFTGTSEEWDAIENKRNWLPYNALVHYDDNKMFMAYGFAGNFGSSGASGLCQIISIRDNQVYIDAFGDVLYSTVTCLNSCEFEYGEYIYDYINILKQPEKLDILDKIKACEEFYVLEGIDQYGTIQERICCYIDGVFYLLTVSSIDEETGTLIINRINYSIFEWEVQ